MTVEIERKFLVAQLPPADTLGPGLALRQGYLADEGDVSVRVRISHNEATLTIKGGSGLSRTEVELVVTAQAADALWPHTAGRRIEKTRHRVVLDGTDDLVAEVDIYDGVLTGSCTVEVEFDSVAAAARFVPPPWFGSELTGVAGWSNAELARHGIPA